MLYKVMGCYVITQFVINQKISHTPGHLFLSNILGLAHVFSDKKEVFKYLKIIGKIDNFKNCSLTL